MRARTFWIAFLIACGHFAAGAGVVAITAAFASRIGGESAAGSLPMTVLVAITRALHFPIISLGWYSRQWFPGPWIAVPMAFNSLVWGGVGAAVLRLVGRIGTRSG